MNTLAFMLAVTILALVMLTGCSTSGRFVNPMAPLFSAGEFDCADAPASNPCHRR